MRRRVLIVEDDPDTIEIARIILDLNGYDVVGIEDSREALARLADAQPDVIIMDLSLRPISGWELLREIRGGSHPSVPIIAFTGYSGSEEESKIRSFGFDGFIPKPCSPDRIVSEVRKFLP